jgi:arylsulfatase A-like enzyme/Flp pilus assembly protein TadD
LIRPLRSWSLLVALAAWSCGRGPSATTAGAPLVLISVDTLRADRLPVYGYRKVQAPALDALARDSVVFERAYSHYPVTLPSHSTLFTGLLPPQHGVRNNVGYGLDDKHLTLAERMKAAGYRTAGVVSSMVLRADTGIAQGFDSYEGPSTRRSRTPSHAFPQTQGAASVEKALRVLEGVKPGERFFLFLHLFDPHAPYDPPEPFKTEYRERPYDGEVAYTDSLIGRLVEALKRRGLYDPALLLFLSDHGEGLLDHGEQEHGIFLYREALHVPLMLKLPKQRQAGERVLVPVGLIDVVPTLVELLDLPAPPAAAPLPGVPLLSTKTAVERVLYAESFFGREQYGFSELRSAIRGTAHFIEAPKAELFDLAADPQERTNLLPKKAVPPGLQDALAAVGTGVASTRQVKREDQERLAALGYVGGPGGGMERRFDLPDPKDHVAQVAELWSLIEKLGKTDSLEPELRVKQLLKELKIEREFLSRTIAHNLLKAGRPKAAREVLLRFEGSKDAATQLVLGEVLATLGQPQPAERLFREVLAREPDNPDACKNMGILLLAVGKTGEARGWLQKALQVDPELAEAWNGLGVVLAQAGDRAGAADAWRKAVLADPALADAWFNLGVTLLEGGDRAGAAQALRRYLPLARGTDKAKAEALLRRLG